MSARSIRLPPALLVLSVLATACTLVSQPAMAGTPLPRELPPYAKDKPLPAPKIVRHRLANGLAVWVVPRQGLPRVDAVLTVRDAGMAADAPTQPGFASLLAGLLTEGTQQRDAKAIAQAAQGLGGGIDATSSSDGISVSAYALASKAQPMLQLLAEVVQQASFPDGEVALAKSNALEALKVSSAQPGFRAEGAMAKAIYGSHPYGNTQPTTASIESTTAASLRAAHGQRFRPEMSLLVIAGRIEPTQALEWAQAAFDHWKASGAATAATPAAATEAKPVRLLLERPGSVQATIRLGRPGVPANHPDHVPLRLASGVIGDGFSSRINMNLREEKGYTYGASARARNFRNGGAISGGADVRNEVTGASLKEFEAEYRRLGSERVPAAELQMTQRYLAGTFLVSTQVQSELAATLARQWLIGLPPEFLADFVPKLQQVTAEQVLAMGKKYFAPEAQSIVVVGDKAAVAEQLKPYGEFTTPAK